MKVPDNIENIKQLNKFLNQGSYIKLIIGEKSKLRNKRPFRKKVDGTRIRNFRGHKIEYENEEKRAKLEIIILEDKKDEFIEKIEKETIAIYER